MSSGSSSNFPTPQYNQIPRLSFRNPKSRLQRVSSTIVVILNIGEGKGREGHRAAAALVISFHDHLILCSRDVTHSVKIPLIVTVNPSSCSKSRHRRQKYRRSGRAVKRKDSQGIDDTPRRPGQSCQSLENPRSNGLGRVSYTRGFFQSSPVGQRWGWWAGIRGDEDRIRVRAFLLPPSSFY